MSTDIRALPAFGKRASDLLWAKTQQRKRELAICPLRFSASVALLVGIAFLLLLEAIGLMGAGGAGFAGGPGAGIVWASGAPNLVAGFIVLIVAAYLAHSAFGMFRLVVEDEPLVAVDTAGIVTLSRDGRTEMTWEEVAQISTLAGFVRLERRPGAVRRLCTSRAHEKRRVWVPALLVGGGAESFREAVSEVRPDIVNRLFS
jgi:hypothetical protein